MIDATKGPVPAWKKYGTIALLAVLVVAMAYVLWVKELKHHSPVASNSAPPAATAKVGHATTAKKAPPTTVPGGLPISSRNPFGG